MPLDNRTYISAVDDLRCAQLLQAFKTAYHIAQSAARSDASSTSEVRAGQTHSLL